MDLIDEINVWNIDEKSLADLFSKNHIDIIIHCATNYGRNTDSKLDTVDANLIFPLQLLHFSKMSGVRCFINSNTILDKRISEYSLSKSQFVDWLRTYSSSLSCIDVTLEHFYGPQDDPSKFVSYIIQSLISGASDIELTPGEQKRDFVFIDDVVEAFMCILKESVKLPSGFFRFEVGSGKSISIREFVYLVKRLTGNHKTVLKLGALPYRENEAMELQVDISYLEKIGWHPRTTLEEGLIKTIEAERERILS
jgi:nucleoside-diphosphate-sugar epimerase